MLFRPCDFGMTMHPAFADRIYSIPLSQSSDNHLQAMISHHMQPTHRLESRSSHGSLFACQRAIVIKALTILKETARKHVM